MSGSKSTKQEFDIIKKEQKNLFDMISKVMEKYAETKSGFVTLSFGKMDNIKNLEKRVKVLEYILIVTLFSIFLIILYLLLYN